MAPHDVSAALRARLAAVVVTEWRTSIEALRTTLERDAATPPP